MSTMNLTPKNPMLLFALCGVAYVVWSSQKANAQGRTPAGMNTIAPLPARAAPVSKTIGQQARTAAKNEANLAGALGGIFQYMLNRKPSVVTPSARDAVRSGDPYYGDTDRSGITGVGGSGEDSTIASPVYNPGLNYEYDVQEF
jgi:hypothetical protein